MKIFFRLFSIVNLNTVLNGKLCKLAWKKMYQIKKKLNSTQNSLYKLLFLTFSFVLKCNLDSFLKAYMSYHSKNCWIVKGLKVQFCKQHHVKVVTSLDQKHYDFIFKITQSKSTYCTSGHRTSQYSVWLLESQNTEISQLILSRNQINVDVNQCPDLTTQYVHHVGV